MILQNYATTHSLGSAVSAIPASLGGAAEASALLTFQPLASDIQDGKPVTSAQIQTETDPDLRQVLTDELLLVPPGTEAAPLLRFQPLASVVQAGGHVTDAQITSIGASDLENLLRQEVLIIPAQKASPDQWKRWWWVCIVGQLVFLALVFTMKGRWSPGAARKDLEERQRIVSAEMERLHLRPEPEIALK